MTAKAVQLVTVWRAINWRAAIALMTLLLSWSVAPAVLWASEPDVCAMECCVAEGHCCCAAQKPFVEGQDHSGVGEIGQRKIEASCPCPFTPRAGSKIFSRQNVRTIPYDLTVGFLLPPTNHSRDALYRSLRFAPRSSRAPPLLLLNA